MIKNHKEGRLKMPKRKIPTSYWSYRWYKINGKRVYVKVRKVKGKIKIRRARRRK